MTMTTFGLCFIILLALLAWATRLDNNDLEDRIQDELDELQEQIKTHIKNHHTSDIS